MTGLQPRSNRRDQFVIEFLQVCLGRPEQGVVKGFEVLGIQVKLRKLELKEAQQAGNSGFKSDWNNFQGFWPKHTNQDSVANPEVLHQQSIRGDSRPDGADRYVSGHLQSG